MSGFQPKPLRKAYANDTTVNLLIDEIERSRVEIKLLEQELRQARYDRDMTNKSLGDERMANAQARERYKELIEDLAIKTGQWKRGEG